MIFNTNKEKGNTGLSIAIAYFGSNGYTVSLPINDTQDYDLIVDKDDIVSRVQVKFTAFKEYENSYKVSLQSSGGTSGKVYKNFINTNVELLFIVCSNKTLFLFPKEVITQKSNMSVSTEKSKFSTNKLDTSEYVVVI